MSDTSPSGEERAYPTMWAIDVCDPSAEPMMATLDDEGRWVFAGLRAGVHYRFAQKTTIWRPGLGPGTEYRIISARGIHGGIS